MSSVCSADQNACHVISLRNSTYSGVCYNEHRCCNERILQPTVFIHKIMTLQQTQMLQRTNSTANSFILKIMKLQRTNFTANSFYPKIMKLQRTQMLQRTNSTVNSFYPQNHEATTNTDATTNEFYSQQFLSIKS